MGDAYVRVTFANAGPGDGGVAVRFRSGFHRLLPPAGRSRVAGFPPTQKGVQDPPLCLKGDHHERWLSGDRRPRSRRFRRRLRLAGVYQQLTKDGYTVSVVQNPTLSLAGDVEATRRVIDAQPEPVILVGHSYGGAVITEAGTDPNVKALVYIAAFMPDAGESVQTLIADLPPETAPPILPPQDGFLLLDRGKFHQAFAGDVDADLAEFMADSQVPWGLDAAGGTISEPAWRSKPSWYLVTTDDRMIPPSLQREMSERAGATIVETPGSHSIYVSQPAVVVDLIERAASEVGSPAIVKEPS
ncbi:MAG TPA: alpha/beta hydrolase [Gaiellaceae bacterium]|nr:alpha/beta hydrolase [Gaiellaceae bacterium]